MVEIKDNTPIIKINNNNGDENNDDNDEDDDNRSVIILPSKDIVSII